MMMMQHHHHQQQQTFNGGRQASHTLGGGATTSDKQGNPQIEMVFRDDFKELVPVPTDQMALSREIRYF
jgi:hypothetical protein